MCSNRLQWIRSLRSLPIEPGTYVLRIKVEYLYLIIGIVLSMNMSASERFDLENYINASMEGLLIQNESHMNTWGIGKSGTWNVDQEAGTITWSFPDGKVATAPVQIIGTYNPNDNSFLWAWDPPSILEPLQEHAKLVKAFGLKHGIQKFTERKVIVSEDEAWEFIAVANRLAGGNGGYRAAAGGPLVFMTFGTITLKNEKP